MATESAASPATRFIVLGRPSWAVPGDESPLAGDASMGTVFPMQLDQGDTEWQLRKRSRRRRRRRRPPAKKAPAKKAAAKKAPAKKAAAKKVAGEEGREEVGQEVGEEGGQEGGEEGGQEVGQEVGEEGGQEVGQEGRCQEGACEKGRCEEGACEEGGEEGGQEGACEEGCAKKAAPARRRRLLPCGRCAGACWRRPRSARLRLGRSRRATSPDERLVDHASPAPAGLFHWLRPERPWRLPGRPRLVGA